MLSITTDYVHDTGNPEPYLRGIAAAGFSHLHWCHHWNTDFLYSAYEVEQIAAWLDDLGLAMLDVHAGHGREKAWGSPREYERLAGVELVENRIAMASAPRERRRSSCTCHPWSRRTRVVAATGWHW